MRTRFSSSVARLVVLLSALAFSACAAHQDRVLLKEHSDRPLQVIGMPQFKVPANKVDVRQDNPVFAMIGLSAKAVQQLFLEYKRTQYENANPEMMQKSLDTMRQGIKFRLEQQGYVVKDLPMNYWEAQRAYRKRDASMEDVDALLTVEIKRFGYFSASPFKPYRPGAVLTADLIATKDRKKLASNVYNIGYDPNDLWRLEFQVNYFTTVPIANRKYFYRNFEALMDHAKQSRHGLEMVAEAAADRVANDLEKPGRVKLVSTKHPDNNR